jgi:hypothetical protein
MPDYEKAKLTVGRYPHNGTLRHASFCRDFFLCVLTRFPHRTCFFYLLWRCFGWSGHFWALRALPIIAGYDLPNGRLRHGVGFRQFNLLYVAFCIFPANFLYIFFGQFRAALSRTVSHASAYYSIVNIVSVCSKFKVIRSNARRLVAFMADDHATRHRTISERERENVSADTLTSTCPILEAAMTSGIAAAPKPATVSFRDIGPEPLKNGSPFSFIGALRRAVFLRSILTVFQDMSAGKPFYRVAVLTRYLKRGGEMVAPFRAVLIMPVRLSIERSRDFDLAVLAIGCHRYGL